MDPFSITVSVSSLLVICTRVVRLSSDLYTAYKSARFVLSAIVSECSVISASLTRLQNMLLVKPDWTNSLSETLDTALLGCALTMSVLYEQISGLAEETKQGELKPKKFKFVLERDHLNEILQQVRGQQMSITLLLQTVQSESMNEVKQSLQDYNAVLQRMVQKGRSLWQANHPSGGTSTPKAVVGSDEVESVFELSSIITDTRFDFDDEVLDSQAYRRALINLKRAQSPSRPDLDKGKNLKTESPYSREQTAEHASDDNVLSTSLASIYGVEIEPNKLDTASHIDNVQASAESPAPRTNGLIPPGMTLLPPEPSSSGGDEEIRGGAQELESLVKLQAIISQSQVRNPGSPVRSEAEKNSSELSELHSRDKEPEDRHKEPDDRVDSAEPFNSSDGPVVSQVKSLQPTSQDGSSDSQKSPGQVNDLLSTATEASAFLPGPDITSRSRSSWRNRVRTVLFGGKGSLEANAVSETSSQAKKRFQFVLVGDSACGKTCLLTRYVTGCMTNDDTPTLFNDYTVYVRVCDEPVELELRDTAGLEGCDHLRPLSYLNIDVVLLCFSLTTESSYKNVYDVWISEVSHFCPGVPIILVGCKKDIRQGRTQGALNTVRKKVVKEHQGQELRRRINAHEYAECSAVTGEGVKNVFDQAITVAFMKDSPKNDSPKTDISENRRFWH